MMATSDWLDQRGWIEGLVGWSMDNVHDALPSDDIDATVTTSRHFTIGLGVTDRRLMEAA